MRLFVRTINGIDNATGGGGPVPADPPEFAEFRTLSDLLASLQARRRHDPHDPAAQRRPDRRRPRRRGRRPRRGRDQEGGPRSPGRRARIGLSAHPVQGGESRADRPRLGRLRRSHRPRRSPRARAGPDDLSTSWRPPRGRSAADPEPRADVAITTRSLLEVMYLLSKTVAVPAGAPRRGARASSPATPTAPRSTGAWSAATSSASASRSTAPIRIRVRPVPRLLVLHRRPGRGLEGDVQPVQRAFPPPEDRRGRGPTRPDPAARALIGVVPLRARESHRNEAVGWVAFDGGLFQSYGAVFLPPLRVERRAMLESRTTGARRRTKRLRISVDAVSLAITSPPPQTFDLAVHPTENRSSKGSRPGRRPFVLELDQQRKQPEQGEIPGK